MNFSPLPLAVFVVDASGAIAGWNKSCEQLAGYTAATIRDLSLEQLIAFDPPDPPELGVAARVEHDSSGQLRCADGRLLPVRVTIAPQTLEAAQADTFSVIVIARSAIAPQRYAVVQDLPSADIIENLPCVFYVIDQGGHLLLWNRQLEAALGMSSAELAACEVERFFDAEQWPKVQQYIRTAFEHGHSAHEADLIGKHGERSSLLFHCARSSLGTVPVVFGTGLDISERRHTEHGLRVRERAIYASVNAILITCCERGEHVIEYVNPAFEQMTGYQLAEVKGRDPRFMRIEGCDVDQHERIRIALAKQESVQAVLRNMRKNGEVFWNDLRIDPVSNADGEVTHFVGVISDVTEARHYERRLHHLAHHDPLTGLANRTLLQEQLGLAIERAAGTGQPGALAFLDLDNFKHINDHFGHDAGDEVLRVIAQRLRTAVREHDTVARVGGDEFVLVINDQPCDAMLAERIERVRRQVNAPIGVGAHDIVPSTSIGVSRFPGDGDTAERVMRAADAAMYHAKSMGKNNCQYYSSEINEVVHEQLMLEASLARAIANDEMVLGFQPKVDLRSGKVVGAEALLRWNHPQEGRVAPDRFIPVAEETGLIVPLGDWVIGQACAALKALAVRGIDDFVISVNLSPRQLRQRQFPAQLAATLADHGVAPDKLELEVTESQLMDRPDEAMAALAQLKALGVRLSIDDFGTGYSSLSHLQKFPVDFIKIDRSFINPGFQNGHCVITRAIIALGHNLKMKVIAEGVETHEQLAFLREHGCDQMQGFYFSADVSQQALEAMLCSGARLED